MIGVLLFLAVLKYPIKKYTRIRSRQYWRREAQEDLYRRVLLMDGAITAVHYDYTAEMSVTKYYPADRRLKRLERRLIKKLNKHKMPLSNGKKLRKWAIDRRLIRLEFFDKPLILNLFRHPGVPYK